MSDAFKKWLMDTQGETFDEYYEGLECLMHESALDADDIACMVQSSFEAGLEAGKLG